LHNFIQQILQSVPRTKLCTIIYDKDNIFKYDEVYLELENIGYKVFNCKSKLDIRCVYELEVKFKKLNSILLIEFEYSLLDDMEEFCSLTKINLKDYFPNLDINSIQGLSFDSLSKIFSIKNYHMLGANQTIKFVLENLYSVNFDNVSKKASTERIINIFILVFIDENDINQPLLDYLYSLCYGNKILETLAKKGLNKESLLKFLEEKWEKFVKDDSKEINFHDNTLIKSISYLFLSNILKNIHISKKKYNEFPISLRVGLSYDNRHSIDQDIEKYIEFIETHIESIENQYQHWFKIIPKIATLRNLCFQTKTESLLERYTELEIKINKRFQIFIDITYNGLFSLSGFKNPVLVTKILDYIRMQKYTKKVLIVFDGMNFWQWQILEQSFQELGLSVDVGGSLAYLPSITAWSRQAIFKGNIPDHNKTNSGERKDFFQYWTNNNLFEYEIDYQKFGFNSGSVDLSQIHNKKMIGLVCNDLDDLMHGSILGNSNLFTSTKEWVQLAKIVQTIQMLIENGYVIYITSDHGSIEATGIGNLATSEKLGAISRSKRHIRFDNKILFDDFISKNSDISLGTKELSIFLKDSSSFDSIGSRTITHGGSHFWELIVPFIEIK
jgi:hypothetical protein